MFEEVIGDYYVSCNVKALLLAAGKGKRLGAISRYIPKPMLKIYGKPFIVHNIEMCRAYGIRNIYINLHHLPNIFINHLGNGKKFGVSITYSYEKEILGTAGAVKKLAKELSDGPFFVIYSDTYSAYNLAHICERHVYARADMSIALYKEEDTHLRGVAIMDKCNWIRNFIEKPQPNEINSHWANGGIYLIEPDLIDIINEGFSDFGEDIIPIYLKRDKKILGVKMSTPIQTVDTPELLRKVLKT